MLYSRYHGMGDGQTGALLRRMEGYVRLMTLVMGGWQEGSKECVVYTSLSFPIATFSFCYFHPCTTILDANIFFPLCISVK